MKECMGPDKLEAETFQADGPLVSVVLATYNPRMDWLKDQLNSLERQTYRPLELLVLDDCSTKVALVEIQRCVEECIQSIPYQIRQNEENLGSTKTFEKLTLLARGAYIAYCDQDDVWCEGKLKCLLGLFTKDNINLAYSDVWLVDESGEITANSITDLRKRHVLYEGPNLGEKLLIQNFVIGCTMLIKSDLAKNAVPFIENMVHDHYLALVASLYGELVLSDKSLVFYRIHGGNQTNTLTKVKNKEDYYQFKIKRFLNRIEQLEDRNIREKLTEFDNIKKWSQAREDFYYRRNVSSIKEIWKNRKFDYNISLFELIMLKMPDFIFKKTLKMIKRGKI